MLIDVRQGLGEGEERRERQTEAKRHGQRIARVPDI